MCRDGARCEVVPKSISKKGYGDEENEPTIRHNLVTSWSGYHLLCI
jgi:hypothetical protein